MIILVLCLGVASVVVADGPKVVVDNPLEYHDRIGIPLAARILEAETAAIQSESRIIGGRPAPLGAHPYLVGAVVHLAQQISCCGSSMLSNTRAVTAAHCWSAQVDKFTMVFGSEYIFFGGVRVDTTDVHMHPGWTTTWSLDYDIAIVNFDYVAYTNVIQPIALPTEPLASNDFAGVLAQTSGWGITEHGNTVPEDQIQRYLTVPVLTNDACRQFYGALVTEKIICTSGDGGVGVCSSDSGGPLSIVHNNQRVLIGVVSFSGSCGGGSPSGFVRVTEHLPWILERL